MDTNSSTDQVWGAASEYIKACDGMNLDSVWNAIDEYVKMCGGSPSQSRSSDQIRGAKRKVEERVLAEFTRQALRREGEYLEGVAKVGEKISAVMAERDMYRDGFLAAEKIIQFYQSTARDVEIKLAYVQKIDKGEQYYPERFRAAEYRDRDRNVSCDGCRYLGGSGGSSSGDDPYKMHGKCWNPNRKNPGEKISFVGENGHLHSRPSDCPMLVEEETHEGNTDE